MDGPRDYYTKWSQIEKDKYHMISLICGLFKKMIQMNLFTKQKQTQTSKTNLRLPKEGGRRDKLEVWD